MNIINLSKGMLSAFEGDCFHIEKWKTYIDASIPGVKEMCLEDMNQMLQAGFSYEKTFLPVLNAVLREEDKRNKTIESFLKMTEHLDERMIKRFQKNLDVDLILYLGLCNGAGWVVSLNGKRTVLFGIEKIMELNWYDKDAMTGLIYHELGHVYQDQYGVLHRELKSAQDKLLWQLFTEGIAMVFEQEIAGDP